MYIKAASTGCQCVPYWKPWHWLQVFWITLTDLLLVERLHTAVSMLGQTMKYMYVIASMCKKWAFFNHFSCLACAATLQKYVNFCSFFYAHYSGAPAIACASSRAQRLVSSSGRFPTSCVRQTFFQFSLLPMAKPCVTILFVTLWRP